MASGGNHEAEEEEKTRRTVRGREGETENEREKILVAEKREKLIVVCHHPDHPCSAAVVSPRS